MKSIVTGIIFLASASAWAMPHLELEMSSREYKLELQKIPMPEAITKKDQTLQQILKIGERNLQWVEKINSVRPENKWIRLSTKETQAGYPLDKPKLYNDKTIIAGYMQTLAKMPDVMRSITLGASELPDSPPISDDEFTRFARLVDGSYQGAARWLLLKPYLNELAIRRTRDIRGYYFLSKNPQRRELLAGYDQLPEAEQNQIKVWLLQMCYNVAKNDGNCLLNFQAAQKATSLNSLYDYFADQNEQLYNSYFFIEGARSDMVVAQVNGYAFDLPFVDPQVPAILRFVKENIEDEWHGTGWALTLQMVGDRPDTAHVEFQPGVTPHVNFLGGDTIVMDKNLSLKDYNNNWTIRHEFGHVLGFPDCYNEFWDGKAGVVVSYQLDLDNLMCSRRGHILPTHFEQLEKSYSREI